ncbi:hypothetical protein GQ54DRAFT_309629 [Martensiomyces pterosporus]|nr:hypothetical protein GQ54DRAFT_309629 [Martensiomyces pterosporus]
MLRGALTRRQPTAVSRRCLAVLRRPAVHEHTTASAADGLAASGSWSRQRHVRLPAPLWQHSKQPRRHISIQPLSSTPSAANANAHQISATSTETQLLELAAEVTATLASTQSAELVKWAERVSNILSMDGQARCTGVLYVDSLEAQALQLTNLGLSAPHNNAEAMSALTKALATSLHESAGPVNVSFGDTVQVVSVNSTLEPLGSDPGNGSEQSNSRMTFLSVSQAESSHGAFADWLHSCSRIVIVANRTNVLHTLARSNPLRFALQFHPSVAVALDNLDTNQATVDAYAGLLNESLSLAGISTYSPLDAVSLGSATASALASSDPAKTAFEYMHSAVCGSGAHPLDLLASALGSAIACAEQGGESAYAQASELAPGETRGVQGVPPLLLAYLQAAGHANSAEQPLVSSGVQQDFENGDLQTVDASVGAMKRRIRSWFASGKIWQSALMRVYEVSDSLIEDAILDRSFEEADLGMVHAAGRLNEAARRVANELASEVSVLLGSTESEQPAAVAAVFDTPSTLLAIKTTLQATALQREPVDQLALARHVWESQKQLATSDDLESIPTHIHWSLAQFWAINASAVAGAVSSSILYDVPIQYATSGGVGLSLVAFVWLGKRWSQLESSLYSLLDASGAKLRAELADAHRAAIQSRLDGSVIQCIKGIARPGCHTAGATAQAVEPSILAAWKARLEGATAAAHDR